MELLVSVIIPVYNSEKYLHICIESILKQTYSNFELILVNDGSTDRSEEICKKYSHRDMRIKVLTTSNSGPGIARNMGLEIAQGDYITFIDSDDFVDAAYLSSLVKVMELENCEIVISGLKQINDFQEYKKKCNIETLQYKMLSLDSFLEHAFLYWWYLGVVGRLYKKGKIEGNRFISTTYSEDLEFNLHYLQNTICVGIIEKPQYLYIQNNNPGSLTHTNNRRKTLDHFTAIDSILKNIPDGNKKIKGRILEILFCDLLVFKYKNKTWQCKELYNMINNLFNKYIKDFLRNDYIGLKRKIIFFLFYKFSFLYIAYLKFNTDKLSSNNTFFK